MVFEMMFVIYLCHVELLYGDDDVDDVTCDDFS